MPAEKSKVQHLAEAVAQANRAYFDGVPTMTDEAYDALRAELRKADPAHPLLAVVGAPVPATALQKARHTIPMGSLANAFDKAGIAAFFKRTSKLMMAAGYEPLTHVTLQPKMDGFSVELVYSAGRLVRAITRGDGAEGEDVTHNLSRAKGVPRALPQAVDLFVRGEVVLHRDEFKQHFPEFANPRNAAAGTARRLDGDRAEWLRFYPFDAVLADGSAPAKTEGKLVALLEEWGFQPVECEMLTAETTDELCVAVWAAWDAMKGRRDSLAFDIDGYVCKVSSIAKSRACGVTDSCPRGQVAMKWAGTMTARTTICGLDLSVGRTGAITPVGTLRPVECGGVTITNVSLCNWDEVARLGVGQGAEVIVERAGEVIPKVTAVVGTPDGFAVFTRPTHCPKCQEETYEDGPRQLCVNAECPGRVFRKVLHWVHQLDILHLGEETVDRLMAVDGPVQTIADLYRLTPKQLADACGGGVMGLKVHQSIEKARHVKLHELIGSVGIPGFGHTDAVKLIRGLRLTSLDGFMRATAEAIAGVRGFGDEKADKITRGRDFHSPLIVDLAAVLDVENPSADGQVATGPLAGCTVCITGATELNRDTLKKILCDAGAEWRSSVVNGLTYLVMADPDSGSVKARAAEAKGVKCISEAAALTMAGYDKG